MDALGLANLAGAVVGAFVGAAFVGAVFDVLLFKLAGLFSFPTTPNLHSDERVVFYFVGK